MTNGQKYKTAMERAKAFNHFCTSTYCAGCVLMSYREGGQCHYAWLDLIYKDKEKLKPCPLCGHTDIRMIKNTAGDVWYVSCNGCGCRTGEHVIKDMAIKAWSKRVK